MDIIVALKYLTVLAMPPASLGVGVLVGLVLLAVRWRRLGLVVMALAIAETLVLSFPPVGDAMMQYLEDQSREAMRSTPRCCFDAIVVLGGAISPAQPPEREFPNLTDSADRLWVGARLYHRGAAPRIVVSGGGFMAHDGGPATTEAVAMRIFLMALGVPESAIVSEDVSLNTIENIRFVRRLVGDGRVAMVTSAYHMPRVMRLASRANLKISPFPSDFRAIPATRPPWENWVPSMDTMGASALALREILALAFDRRGETMAP